MEGVEGEVKQRRKRYILTALAATGYGELSTILRILKTVYQVPEEEVEQYVRELESRGFIGRLQDKLFITEKGVEALREVGVDEGVVRSILEGTETVAQPFTLPPCKPSLAGLELTPMDAEVLSSLTRLEGLSPLMLSVKRPRLIPLDTRELLVEEVGELLLEIPAPKLMSLVKPKIKLIELDSSQQAIGEPPFILVKPLTIRLRPPKLIDVEKSTPLHQLTTPVSAGSEERRVKALELEEEGVGEGDVLSVLEGFFELEEPDEVIGVAGVMYDRPVIVVAIRPEGYEYIDILRHILRVLYRIAVGGLPQGMYLTPAKPSTVDWPLKVNLEVEKAYFEGTRRDVIKVIEFTRLESSKSIDFGLLRNRLKEHLVEGLSFTVIYVDEGIASDIIRFVDYHKGEFGAEVIIVRPRRLSQEQLYKLAALSWGYTSIPERPYGEESGQLQIPVLDPNSIFTSFAEKFNRDLRRIYSSAVKKGIAELVRPSRQDSMRESTEHYLLKVFATYYFVEKEQVDIRDIAVEETICGHVVPDVYIRSRNIAIEIETLYGEGLAWPNKLRETIEKYKRCTEVSEVWLVLPPMQASVYSKYLVSMAKRLRELKVIEASVKVLTVDLEEEMFVPVARVGKQLREVVRS